MLSSRAIIYSDLSTGCITFIGSNGNTIIDSFEDFESAITDRSYVEYVQDRMETLYQYIDYIQDNPSPSPSDSVILPSESMDRDHDAVFDSIYECSGRTEQSHVQPDVPSVGNSVELY